MTVYVDTLVAHPAPADPQTRRAGAPHGHRWCHMFTDGDLAELHAIAARIGLKRAWFQDHPTLPHYDLTPPRRGAAIAAGAVPCDRHKTVEVMRANRTRRHNAAPGGIHGH
jgi:hypothetical protein